MARFEEVKKFSDTILGDKKCYLVNGYLSLEDVNTLNDLKESIYLIFNNTKGQKSNIIGLLDSNIVSICIVGGTDYLNRKKYLSNDYINRTIFRPKELQNILTIFEDIERNVDSSWSDLEKCLYVYKVIVESINYDDTLELTSSSLNGLTTRRVNYIGIATIFKEAMDRLDIECHYQSKIDEYSWNVVKLDGEYRVMDIAWEICSKSSKGCSFKYFCRLDSNKFYEDPHHDISKEKDEIRFPAKLIEDDKLLENIEKILKSRFMVSTDMTYYKNAKDEEFYYLLLGESFGHLVYIIRFKDYINYFYLDKGIDIRKVLDNETLGIACYHYKHNISKGELSSSVKKFSRYTREDGSNFLVCFSNSNVINDIKSYILIEPYTTEGKTVLIRSKIYSENDLVNLKSPKYKKSIANELLNRERLKNRIDNYNGYVGYICDNVNA